MKNNLTGVLAFMIVGLFGIVFIYQMSFKETQPPRQDAQPYEDAGEEFQAEVEELRQIEVNKPISYSLQNNQLSITFDGGKTWVRVPVEKEQLFGGEYNGNKQELIPNSYILTEERAAFIYIEGPNWETEGPRLAYSEDKGVTWRHSVIADQFQGVRFRKVAFLNDIFGYIILSGGRTMSQEGTGVYLTHDGGETWSMTAGSGQTRLLYDGGFTDEKTGFLSYGTINPTEPDFHVTHDGGASWQQAEIRVPEKYSQIFVTAEIPVIDGHSLVLLANQGPNGDYLGGKVKGKFISQDNGLTWEFAGEVPPEEVE